MSPRDQARPRQPLMLRIPMRGYELLPTGRVVQDPGLRIPMRGYERVHAPIPKA